MRLPVNQSVPLAALAMLAACGSGGENPRTAPPPIVSNGPASDYPLTIGDPFVIDGVTHTPIDRMNYDSVGYATSGSDGGDAVSAAHKTLPVPSYVEVTSLDSGRTILVRIERRGPMTNDRLIELSPGAAAQLGQANVSRAPIRVRRVNPPEAERALLRGGQRAPDRMETPKPLLAVLMRKLDPQLALPPSPPVVMPTAAPQPVAAPSPAASRPAPMKRLPRPRPVATAVPSPDAMPNPAPSPKPAVRPAAAQHGTHVVQVAAFSTKARADTVAAKLGGHASPAGSLWRVRMGPYATTAQAQAALAKARGAGYSDARVQRAD